MHAALLKLGFVVLLASMQIWAPQAMGEEEIVDLQGGPLIGFDVQPDVNDYFPPTPFFDFQYSVPSGESVRLTNGVMFESPWKWWYDYFEYHIVIDGELIFGDGFPTGGICSQCQGATPIQVNGVLRIDNSITEFIGFVDTAMRISSDGILIVEQGRHATVTAIESEGTISLERDSFLDLGVDADLSGSGELRLAEFSNFYGSVSDHHILLDKGSVIHPNEGQRNLYELPDNESVVINSDAPGSAGTGSILSSELIIKVVPEPGNETVVINHDYGMNPFYQTTIRLLSAGELPVGTSSLCLRTSCGPCESYSLDSNTLIPPQEADGKAYELRWNTDGLYVLAMPESWCPADLTFDGVIDVFDVFAYLDHFQNGSVWANMTIDQAIDVFDVFAYLDLFAAGCP